MQFVFGSGQLFAQPEGFDNGATSPVQVGALRGVAVEMGFNPKALHGGGHWPLAIGRGTGKVPCKADFAQFTADGFNALFFGGPVPTTGCTRVAVDEAQVVASNAVAATHAGTFTLDLGVTAELPSGAIFTRVAGAPAAQEYTCDETTGDYAFAPGTDGNTVRLNYLYADTANGRQITIANRFIGNTPRFSAVLTETFNGKAMTLTLPHCVASRLGFRSKANDFMVPSFSFGAAADDSGLVGSLSVEEGGTATTRVAVVNLDAVSNAGNAPAVGVTISGLDPAVTYTLLEPTGLSHIAWRSNLGEGWRNHFVVTTSAGNSQVGNVGTLYGSAEAARAAFLPAQIVGFSSYTFWLQDPINPLDNIGGLSIAVEA